MEKSCGIVLFSYNHLRERMFLLLHYNEGHWDFPKGHVEKGESEKQTALRELFEETGIKYVEFVDGFRERIEYSFDYNGKKTTKEVFYFLALCDYSNAISISGEHIGFEWLSYHEALKRITYNNAKNILLKAERFLSK